MTLFQCISTMACFQNPGLSSPDTEIETTSGCKACVGGDSVHACMCVEIVYLHERIHIMFIGSYVVGLY